MWPVSHYQKISNHLGLIMVVYSLKSRVNLQNLKGLSGPIRSRRALFRRKVVIENINVIFLKILLLSFSLRTKNEF